jgi:hypothetical protein
MNTTKTMNPMNNEPTSASLRSRLDPRNWSTGKKLTAGLVTAVVLTGAWAAFRPERLFINSTVNESFPTLVGQNAPSLLSQGSFTSLGHHTEGTASIYKQGNGYTLRLANFSTSNGPDVRVYLTTGAGTDNAAIKSGKFLDLGVIKGNIGDQNYMLPASFNPADYRGVSIWCKRFGVNFAGASLDTPSQPVTAMSAASSAETAATVKADAAEPNVALMAASAASDSKAVTVTTGAFHQVAHATKGTAIIAEDSQGNRTLTLRGFKTSAGPQLSLYLYKAEDVKDNAAAKKLVTDKQFVDLGALKSTSGTQTYNVPKGIDLWQYLAVGVWCDKFDVNFGTAPLSSPQ